MFIGVSVCLNCTEQLSSGWFSGCGHEFAAGHLGPPGRLGAVDASEAVNRGGGVYTGNIG